MGDYMEFGEKIKKARKKSGLTQSQLGNKLGVSASMLAQYETGKRKPKIETLLKLSEAMGVPLDELIGLEEEEKTSPDTEPPVSEEENNPETLETAVWLQELLIKAGWVKPGEDLSDKQYRLLRAIILLLQEGMEPQ